MVEKIRKGEVLGEVRGTFVIWRARKQQERNKDAGTDKRNAFTTVGKEGGWRQIDSRGPVDINNTEMLKATEGGTAPWDA